MYWNDIGGFNMGCYVISNTMERTDHHTGQQVNLHVGQWLKFSVSHSETNDVGWVSDLGGAV